MQGQAGSAGPVQTSSKAPGCAAALWRPATQLAVVFRHGGKLLTRMGFTHRGEHCLHIEEAVFLVGRSLLELFTENCGERCPVDFQQAVLLMGNSGFDAEHFLVYSYLMQGSMIVRRQPARWSLDDDEDANQVWTTESALSDGRSDFHSRTDMATAFDVLAPNSNFSRKRPDLPVLRVCIARDGPPTGAVLNAAEARTPAGAPVAFATVSGGEVSIYTFEKSSLPDLPDL